MHAVAALALVDRASTSRPKSRFVAFALELLCSSRAPGFYRSRHRFMGHSLCGRLDLFAGLNLGSGLRPAERAAVMGLCACVGVEVRAIALVPAWIRRDGGFCHQRCKLSPEMELPSPVGEDGGAASVPTVGRTCLHGTEPADPPEILVCADSGAVAAIENRGRLPR